jgi:hypothetical protein
MSGSGSIGVTLSSERAAGSEIVATSTGSSVRTQPDRSMYIAISESARHWSTSLRHGAKHIVARAALASTASLRQLDFSSVAAASCAAEVPAMLWPTSVRSNACTVPSTVP